MTRSAAPTSLQPAPVPRARRGEASAPPGRDGAPSPSSCEARRADDHRGWHRLATRAGVVQARLTVNAPGDRHEQEADRVAERVLRMPDPAPVQRKCAACEEEEGTVQRQAAPETPAAPPSIQRLGPGCQEAALQRQQEEEVLQAKQAPSASPSASPFAAPSVAPRTESRIASLRGGGRPLPEPVRSYFEPRFGRDFGNVRVHTGGEAATAAREIRARAFTIGSDVAFAPGEYRPDTTEGRRLLAHELVHTVQQGAVVGALQGARGEEPSAVAGLSGARRPSNLVSREEEEGEGSGGGTPSPWRPGTQCNRPNRENTDFPRTHIDRINVDLGDMTAGLTLHWANPTGLNLPTGGFPISPGAGRCCRDCNDTVASTVSGSMCTPKGNWRVHGKSCVLSNTSWATNPTYFSRSGIAIHTAPPRKLPGYPDSHGCVRTTAEASAIVHDNTIYSSRYQADPERGLPDRRTEVVVSGTWNGPRCYDASGANVPRSRACATRGGKGGGSEKSEAESPSAAPSAAGTAEENLQEDGP